MAFTIEINETAVGGALWWPGVDGTAGEVSCARNADGTRTF